MAEDSTTAPAPIDAEALQRAIAALQPPTQVPVPTEGGPATHGIGGFLSDVGTALSGGQTGLLGLSPDEQASAGRHALLRFGIDMLAASGKSYAPKDFGSVLAAGLGGAQQAQQESENRAYVGRGASQQLAQQAFQNRIAAAKEALPLLIAGQNAQIPNPLVGGGGKPNTSISTAAAADPVAGMPREKALDAIALRESANQNVPNSAGTSTASGYWQILDSTWQDGAKLAGVDVSKYPRAMDAPRDVQRTVAGALLDKYGVAPWAASAPGKGVAARTGGTDVAGPGAGKTAPAAPAADLVGPRPLPPIGPASPVVTPQQIANTPTPATPPPAVPAAPAQQTFEDFQKAHPVAVDPASYAVEPPNLDALTSARDTAAQQLSLARAGRGGDVNKSLADYNTAAKAVTDAQAAATAKSAELRQKAQQAATDTQRQLYDAEMQRQQTAAENDKNRQNQIDLKNVEAEQARKTASAASENSFVLDTRKKLTDERSAAQENVDNLGLLDNLSKAAGAATPLDSLNWGGMPLRQWLLQKNIGSADQIAHWGAQQAYEAAINQTVIGLRKGVSMGALSDRDLSFLQGMSPSVLQRPETREAITAYLRSAQLRKIRFADSVDELWDGGKGMSYGQALVAARKQLPDIVPQIPAGASNTEKRDWFTKNVPAGTLYRNARGDLTVWPGMPADQPQVPRD